MKQKICFIIPSLGGGGAERVAFHLLNNLNLNKFNLNVVIIYRKKGDYLKDLRKEVKTIFLEKDKIRYSIPSLYKVLKEEKPDIVVNFSFDLMMLIGTFVIPFFENTYFMNRQINILSMQKFSFFKKILLKVAYKNFNKIITQSKDMTEDLLKNIDISKEKIIEINNPVDIDRIEKLSNENIEIEFDKDCKNLLCVGRLAPQKGFDSIIEIISLINDENIKLYVLGEGEEKESLLNLIDKLNLKKRVFLLGRKSNPYIYMKNADLFILSSRYEGFPNVLIEAGACGLYSICNNCPGGVNEIILEDINGNIVDFDNEKLVAKIIEKTLTLNRDKEKIKNSIKSKYSLDKIINKYESLLKKCEKEKKCL